MRWQGNERVNSEKLFRSLCVYRHSAAPIFVNVLKGAIAAPLTIPAPGGKIVAAQYPPLIPSGYRAGREVASLQNAP